MERRYQPRWGWDGQELYYVVSNRMLVAEKIHTVAGMPIGRTEELFEIPFVDYCTALAAWNYDVSADGRLIVVENADARSAAPSKTTVRVIEDWSEAFPGSEQPSPQIGTELRRDGRLLSKYRVGATDSGR